MTAATHPPAARRAGSLDRSGSAQPASWRQALAAPWTSLDRLAPWIVLAVAAGLRLAFLFRVPPLYVGGDSETYLQPASELVLGLGFDPEAKRAPVYPLFLAGLFLTLGRDLQGVLFAQHVLGCLTALATWALGRLAFGPAAGLLAGLAVALNGALLITEHFVLSETLTTCLLALALLVTLWRARHAAAWPVLLGGGLFGLAAATHPRTQAVLLLVPLALAATGLARRQVVRQSVLVGCGFLLVALPWWGFEYARHGVFSASTLGEHLTWRLTRNDDEEFYGRPPRPVDDRELQQARVYASEAAADRVLPSDIKVGLQQRFGLSEFQADGVLRSLAIESIARQPDRYLSTSLDLLLQNLRGDEQWFGGQGKKGGVVRYAEVESRYGSWWSPTASDLVQNATPGQEREFERARALASLFQPHQYDRALLALFAAGLVAGLVTRRPLGFVLGLMALGLLVLVAFVIGFLPRYRYPADPLLAIVQAGGLVWLVSLVWRLPRRARLKRR